MESHPFASRAMGAGLTALLALAAGPSCNVDPECKAGDFIYVGRPDRTLFAYEDSCREDCFSPARSSCDPACAAVAVAAPTGLLLDDRADLPESVAPGRVLMLVDATSLGDDRALVFTFGFDDLTGGTAPLAWGFFQDGPRIYEAGQVAGDAEFKITASVYEVLDGAAPILLGERIGGPIEASPGRLEITRIDEERIAGMFFLGFLSATEQRQEQVNACFKLDLAAHNATPGAWVWSLGD